MFDEFLFGHLVIAVSVSISESCNFCHEISTIVDSINIEKFLPWKASITIDIDEFKKSWPITFLVEIRNSDFWSFWLLFGLLVVITIWRFSIYLTIKKLGLWKIPDYGDGPKFAVTSMAFVSHQQLKMVTYSNWSPTPRKPEKTG